MDIHIPRKTEYKGIVFKSKSEAIVARSMDLAGCLWRYEPIETLCQDGYILDFWIVIPQKLLADNIGFHTVFMEYKPSKPTDTYCNELYDRVRSLKSTIIKSLWVLYGTPFDNVVPSGVMGTFVDEANDSNKLWVPLENWNKVFIRRWAEAKQYRFDLKQ
jgi:hypothetical protein